MKFLALVLAAGISILGSTGCYVYTDPTPTSTETGYVNYCDTYGCREVYAPHYYTRTGDVVYWDTHFGVWITPHGYWRGGRWNHGYHPGYHHHYYGRHQR